MKKIISKKILALCIAGSMSGVAFADDTFPSITSDKVIQGKVPYIKSSASADKDNKYTVTIKRNGAELKTPKTLQVGDEVTVSFVYGSESEDAPDNFLNKDDASKANLIISYLGTGNNREEDARPFTIKPSKPATLTDEGKYTFTIEAQDVGKRLYIYLKPKAQYGTKRDDANAITGHLFDTDKMAGKFDDKFNPIILPAIKTLVAYVVLDSDESKIIAKSASAPEREVIEPKVGGTYKVIVYSDSNTKMSDDSVANLYDIKWFLDGTNSSAVAIKDEQTTLKFDSVSVTTGTAYKYTIGTNTTDEIISKLTTKPKAGAQGFKLGVNISTK